MKTLLPKKSVSKITAAKTEQKQNELENRIKELELKLSLLKSGKAESPLLENVSLFYNAGADPSEQKKAENALKESEDSEKRYNMMLMKSPFAFAVLKGKNMVITLANDSVKEMWGKGKDLEGKPLLEVLPELKDSEFPVLLNKVYTTGIPFSGEELLAPVFRNGKLEDVYFNFVYQPYQEADETISGVTVIAYEVTAAVLVKKALEAQYELEQKALKQIEESEQRLRLATQTSGVGIWEWNLVTNKIRWDAQMFYIYGVIPTADGFVDYSTWRNAVVTEDLADQERILQDTVRIIGSSKRSFKIIRASDGVLSDIEAIEIVRANAEGNAKWVVGTNLDVTEQKQASQYARSLIEASLDPLVTISADGKITDVNEASIKVTGVEREKLIDTDFSNYFTEPKKAQEGYQQVFEKGFVADYPLTIKHKNGNLTDVLYNASVYKDDKGNVLGVFAAARDITARKKAEEKIKESEVEVRKIKEQLELSITAGKIGVWHWDVKNDLLYWSKEQHEIYGFDKSETVTSSTQFNALIVSGDLKRIQDDQSAGNKLEHEYDFQITRKNDGELRWIKSRAKNTFNSQGVLQYISGVNIDITEQKLFEEKLIEAKTSAENAAKSRQQFLSNMSHEIRTPLNSILGFTNVLLKTELGLQQKEFVEAIKTSGKSLNLLINDILDLAKVDAGKMTFEIKPFEIRKSITALLHSFNMKIREKNLELDEVYDFKIPPVLVGDSLRLNQIILNLISNAIKFTHKGKIKLTVKFLHEDKENMTIEFIVSDSGIGIADNKLNTIFNIFEQAEINTSTS